MPDFTFAAAPVLVETTGDFAIGATGVLRPTDGADAVPIFDLNGSPLASIVVGPKGAHQAFMADISFGVLDFGSVQVPTSSLEQQAAALTAIGMAESATTFATAAQVAADAALAAALSAGKFIIHGSDPNVARTTDPAVKTVWFGTVAPVNIIDNFDLWMNTASGGGGVSSVTVDNIPAGSVLYVKQNSNGTWPNRPTARTNVVVLWLRVVASSSDPASVTAPSLLGAYTTDVVLGA